MSTWIPRRGEWFHAHDRKYRGHTHHAGPFKCTGRAKGELWGTMQTTLIRSGDWSFNDRVWWFTRAEKKPGS